MNLDSLEENIRYVNENNWTVVSNGADVWTGELPFKPGDAFPTEDIKHRAAIAKTNQLLYDNEVDEILSNIISIFPEIDPMNGWQIRQIIMRLPYFKNATNAWVGLLAGEAPIIDTDDSVDEAISKVIEGSNFTETLQNEIKSRFMSCISAYRVDVTPLNKPTIVAIEGKNLICYVNKDTPNFIEVTVVFSIYTEDKREYIDFVEYYYNGVIKKRTYEYNEGYIGEQIGDEEIDYAFNGVYKESPIVVFKHNATGNNVYGTDQYRYWISSILSSMRTMQNVMRLSERTREMIRKVPSSAIKKNSIDGSSVFFNKGTVSYNENAEKTPDMEYVVPEIRMEEAIKASEAAVKQIGMDTELGITYFSPEMLGSNLSAESIKAAMLPSELKARSIKTEMLPSIKELIIKLGYIAGIAIEYNNLSVKFKDSFPRDEEKFVKAIQARLESKTPSISLVDAIVELDSVPLRVAKQKALEIQEEIGKKIEKGDIGKVKESNEILVASNLRPTAGDGGNIDSSSVGEYADTAVWESQMYPKPRNIEK